MNPSFLLLRVLWLAALGRRVLLVPSQLDPRHFVVELPELLVLFDVGRGLIGQRTDELVDLQRTSRHPLAHLHQSALSDHLIDGFAELDKKIGTFPPV